MGYKISSLVKDKTVKRALEKALSNDGRIDSHEVIKIIKSTGSRVSYQEFRDIQIILRNSKSLDHNSKLRLLEFLGEHYYYNLLTKIKDPSVKKALAKALYGDGVLDFNDVKNIIKSTEDYNGLTAPEYDDLKTIMNKANIVGAEAKNYFRKYFSQHSRPSKPLKYANPTGKKIRGTDNYGSGHHGASRGSRTHDGADYESKKGQQVKAPMSGKVIRVSKPYSSGTDASILSGLEILASDGTKCQIWYIKPKTGVVNEKVQAGKSIIGVAQTLNNRYPGIIDHVHIRIHDKQNNKIDPSTVIR